MKKGKQKLRPTLTWLAYCALTGFDPHKKMPKDIAKLAAATDLELYAEYLANWNVDNKGAVRTNPMNRKKAAIAAKSFLEDAVRLVSEVGPEFVKPIIDGSREVTKGWVCELTQTTTENVDKFQTIEEYLKTYSLGMALTGVGKTLSLGVRLVSIYIGLEKTVQAKHLTDLYDRWGIEIEIINALGDFLPELVSTDKASDDSFADIKNHAMTPPIYLMLKACDEKTKNKIIGYGEDTIFTKSQKKELVKLLFTSGSYLTTSKALKRSGREIKKTLRKIPYLHEPALSILKVASTIFITSTIYNKLEEFAPKNIPKHKGHDIVLNYHIGRYKNLRKQIKNKIKELILVNEKDEEIGRMEKLEAHKKGLLHRAFSVLIFHNKKLLLQKRAKTKYHSGGLWTNSCCSHPEPNQEMEDAIHKRVKEEIGCKIKDLKYVGKFKYKVKLKDLYEHELDYVYFAKLNSNTKLNPEEVEEIKYEDVEEIKKDIKQNPKKYTYWFKKIMDKYIE
ncbi:MAG: isopentenyl-diphosphate Delta-isomerase [Candidatus Woesearchaeota archaeon]